MEFEINTVVTYKALDDKMKIHFIKDKDSNGIFEFKQFNPSKTVAIPYSYVYDAIKMLDTNYNSFMVSTDYSVYQLNIQKIGKDDKPLFIILEGTVIRYSINLDILKEMIDAV